MGEEWTNEFEIILAGRCDKARCMGWLCAHTSTYYGNQRTGLLLPASVISWSLNIFGMIATYIGKERLSEDIVILVVSLGNFIVATLTSIAERGKAGDKVELFSQTARDFNLIASEIKHQLMLPRQHRKHVRTLLDGSELKYNDLMKSTPNIPDPVINGFMRKHRKDMNFNKMAKPESLMILNSVREFIHSDEEGLPV